MRRLAPDLGLSGSQLSLLCDQYELAKPGYGYWTLREMGRPVDRPPLGPSTRDPLERVVIIPSSPRKQRSPRPIELAPPSSPPGEAPVPEPEPQLDPTSAPSSDHRGLHPAAQRTQSKLAGAASKGEDIVAVGGKSLFKVTASPAQAERIGLVLSGLAYAIEQRGWPIKADEHGLRVVPDGEPLSFELLEQTDRVPHVVTEKETAALRRFEEQRVRAVRTGSYFSTWDKPKVAEWDYVPSGRLTLAFTAGYHHGGLRRTFSDGKRQRLEGLTETILNSFAAYAAGEKAWRVEQERRRLEAIEQENRRREAERRRTLEAKRLEFLTRQMERHESAKRIESFVACFAPEVRHDEQVAALLEWAAGYAARIRLDLSVETLRAKLKHTDLMNDNATISSWRDVD